MSAASRLAGLPAFEVAPGDELFRVYRTTDEHTGKPRGPWYFASLGGTRKPARAGRFDLKPPEGTCYLSDSPAGAYREVFESQQLVDPADEAVRALAMATPNADQVRFGDIASPDAEALGFSLEEAASRNRRVTQKVAREVRAAGFDGVRALRRSDPAGRTYTFGLYGPAGPNVPSNWDTTEGLTLVRPARVTHIPLTMPIATPPAR